MEKLVLIDGNSLINRAFYAMPLLTTKDGTPTNAVFGFMNMFFKMVGELKPTHVGVAFDLKAPTFRHKMFSEYKGTRKPMPEELRPQIPLLKELLNLMGVKTFEKEGFEADDIIGTIAKSTNVQTVIFTGDKDSFQLVDSKTEVHFTRRGITDVEIYNIDNFNEKTGIAPLQIIDLKALMGDSSDNILGVQGVGEKTAKTLIQTYGDVETLYQNVGELKGKLREKIEQGKESAFLSKTLATIVLDAPIDTSLDGMILPKTFPNSAKKRFIELEFSKLLSGKDKFFEQQTENVTSEIAIKTQTVEDFAFLSTIINADFISFYISEKAVFLCDGKTEYVIPIRENLFDSGFSLAQAIGEIKEIFCRDKTLIVWNKKELKRFLYDIDIPFTCPVEDVSIMKYLADYSGKEEKLFDLISEYSLNENTPTHSLFTAFNTLSDKLKEEEMVELYKKVELPLSDVLFDMENAGFKIDFALLSQTSVKYQQILSNIENKIREITGDYNLNVNSPKQLGDLLFEKLKIGKGKKTKNGYSTNAEILESFEDAHPVIPLILQYRRIQKLQSTYVEGFKPLIQKNTGLIHTTFNQTLTSTGRLSSKEPNLQNIPVRDDEGKEIRKFFVPRSDDRILIGADYSQIELRLLACFSLCPDLIKAFKEGKDVHAITASKVFKVSLDQVTPQMRSRAKAVNFGIIYGMSEYGLAKQLKISNAEAREYINSYFSEYPEVKEYMDKNVAFAKQNGYAKTLLGRRRYIRELLSTNYNLRQFGERVAMNMPLQGSSADIIKLAMLGVSRRLSEEGLKSQLILQVHDELIVDALLDEKERVEKILIEEMEGAVNLAVSLTVSVGSGKTWFDAK